VKVWSAAVIHSTFTELTTKIILLSLVAFEKLITVDTDSARDWSELSMWTQMSNGRTTEVTSKFASDEKKFKGM